MRPTLKLNEMRVAPSALFSGSTACGSQPGKSSSAPSRGSTAAKRHHPTAGDCGCDGFGAAPSATPAAAAACCAVRPPTAVRSTSAPLAPPRAKQLSLFRRARVRVEIWRIRVSAFLHPGGKNAAKLLVPPDSTAARRSFLLAAVLSWCKHSGELAIPVVDWTDSDLLMRNFTAAGGSSETPSCKFCVQSYGLSCADLPRVQKRALKEVGFLYADYQSACWYWESAELGRKLVLTSILTLIAPGSAGQVLVGLLIAFFMLVLNLRLRPYADSGLNSMNALSQYNLFFFLLVALLLKVNLDGDTSKDFFSYIVGVLTVVPVVLPVLIRIYLRLGGFGAQGKEMKRVFSDGLRAD